MLIFNCHLCAYIFVSSHNTPPIRGNFETITGSCEQLMDELEKCRKDSSVVNKTTKMGEHSSAAKVTIC